MEDELIAKVARAIEAMPQPDQSARTAAFFGAVIRASGLTEREAAAAFLRAVRVELQLPYAKLSLAREDGEWFDYWEDGGPFGTAG